jgi:hypothetical protein
LIDAVGFDQLRMRSLLHDLALIEDQANTSTESSAHVVKRFDNGVCRIFLASNASILRCNCLVSWS